MGRRSILQVEVKAAAGDAYENEHQLILQREAQGLGPQCPQSQIRKTHAQRNNLNGREGLQHHLGQHEAAAPYQRCEQGEHMARELLIFGKNFL